MVKMMKSSGSERSILIALGLIGIVSGDEGLWSDWWAYSGISGPRFWGLLNKEWLLCSKGKHQSPVDINPKTLVFDPNLRPIRINDHKVHGYIVNRGFDITLFVNESRFTFTGGPLSYTYRVHHLTLHFGSMDVRGSEHTVDGRAFPMEIYGFNSDIYSNFSTAVTGPHGIAVIALFGMITEDFNQEFDSFIKAMGNIPFKGNSSSITDFSIKALMPDTKDYMTYEGSLTQPGCFETSTWIIFNKPLHIRKEQLILLRALHESPSDGDEEMPPLLEKDNYRGIMPPNRRTIRTNLAPQKKAANCGNKKIAFYEVNSRYQLN